MKLHPCTGAPAVSTQPAYVGSGGQYRTVVEPRLLPADYPPSRNQQSSREVHEFTKASQHREGELLTFEGLIFGARIVLMKGTVYCTRTMRKEQSRR